MQFMKTGVVASDSDSEDEQKKIEKKENWHKLIGKSKKK